jgi:hypothetical protein
MDPNYFDRFCLSVRLVTTNVLYYIAYRTFLKEVFVSFKPPITCGCISNTSSSSLNYNIFSFIIVLSTGADSSFFLSCLTLKECTVKKLTCPLRWVCTDIHTILLRKCVCDNIHKAFIFTNRIEWGHKVICHSQY